MLRGYNLMTRERHSQGLEHGWRLFTSTPMRKQSRRKQTSEKKIWGGDQTYPSRNREEKGAFSRLRGPGEVETAFYATTSKGLHPVASLPCHTMQSGPRLHTSALTHMPTSYRLDSHPRMPRVRCLVDNLHLPITLHSSDTTISCRPRQASNDPVSSCGSTQPSQILVIELRITETG